MHTGTYFLGALSLSMEAVEQIAGILDATKFLENFLFFSFRLICDSYWRGA
jgi:hypothetical protein